MRKKKRFFWHLFPYFIGVILFSITLMIWYSSTSIRGFYLDETEGDLKIRAQLLAQQLTPYIISPDPIKIDQACKFAGNERPPG